MVIATQTEYKGNAILELKWHDEDLYPFKFGIRKAQLIIESIDEIKKFVEENKKE